VLGDRSGSIPAVVAHRDDDEGICRPGAVVVVTGMVSGAQITVRDVREARDGEYAPEDLHDGPARDLDQMERDLRDLLATIQNHHLRLLLNAVLADAWPGYRDAP